MNPAELFRSDVVSSLIKASGLKRKEIDSILEKPPKEVTADLAFPCFSLAKKLKKSPVQIAADISVKLKIPSLVKEFDLSGPYINFYADWSKLGSEVLKEAISGKKLPKNKKKILIEFAHPNTHKSFHIGHVRNIALGESLSRILEHVGFEVIRANYQGDIGPHVAKCLWLLKKNKPPKELKGHWLGEVYAKANKKIQDNPSLEEEVREINKKLYAGDKELRKLWEQSRKWSLDYFEIIYQDFWVKYDRYYFESEVEKPAIVLAKKLLKKKIAKKSEGAIIMNLKPWDLGIFVLLTQDQTPLYSIKDFVLAEQQDKEFHPSKIIHVVGTEQILHFRQLFKSLELINPEVAKKEVHLPYELVNLASGKMSSREGKVITYYSLLEEVLKHALKETKKHSPKNLEDTAQLVALGAIKYDMLKQSPEKVITFDWKHALSFEGNAAPYLQYTHARACSILAKASVISKDASLLEEKKELAILRKLMEFPGTIQAAARDFRPHYMANYAFELATTFNDFYQNIPVLKAGREKRARLGLVKAFQKTMETCLNLLGIEAPKKM